MVQNPGSADPQQCQLTGDALEKEITAKAQAEADAIVDKARAQIEQEKEKRHQELQATMAEILLLPLHLA